MEKKMSEKTKKDEPKNKEKGTFGNLNSDFFDGSGNPRFPKLDFKILLFLQFWRDLLWQNVEKAARKAGWRSVKKVYEILKRPEVMAAANELKAIDALKAQGDRLDILTLAGISEIAFSARYRQMMFDGNGAVIKDLSKFPKELLPLVKKFKCNSHSYINEAGNKAETAEFEVQLESPMAALKELRKHLMEIGAFRKDDKVVRQAEEIFKKREQNELSLIETVRLFEIEGLPLPESIKLELQDYDWEMENRIAEIKKQAEKALEIAKANCQGSNSQ